MWKNRKMKRKTTGAVLLAALLLCGLTACGGSSKEREWLKYGYYTTGIPILCHGFGLGEQHRVWFYGWSHVPDRDQKYGLTDKLYRFDRTI